MQLIWFLSPNVCIHFTSLKIISSLFALYLVVVHVEYMKLYLLQPISILGSYALYAAAKGEKMWLSLLFSQNVWIHFTSLAKLYPLYFH